ncbi:autotransporter domain-containing protein [Bordetella avium]|uniref:autotransporter domain-containing protein n=1 Tax=Bordetella avium TaxID=521 RepID=UPI001F4D67A1|nr:autotransporter domain-containing protein [Bordetella avium]
MFVGPLGTVGVLLGTGGTAMRLEGNQPSVFNNGRIDVFELGSALGVLSSGLVIRGASDTPMLGKYIVENRFDALIRGSGRDIYEAQLADLTGMALSVNSGIEGTVTNYGTISAAALANGSRLGADIAAVALYGGGAHTFINQGTIEGRVALATASSNTQGNRFTNAGTIKGSVSLGASGRNTFTAEFGSSVSGEGLTTGAITVASMPGLLFAAPGIVDGGAGGVNSLVLADTARLSQSTSTSTSIVAGTYLNFSSLTVNGGRWALSGGPLLPAGSPIQLNGGTVLVDASGALGNGQIYSAGGAIAASAPNIVLSNAFRLESGGLALDSTQPFTLSGALSGYGTLSVTGTGTVSLTGGNAFLSGTTIVIQGASLAGTAYSLPSVITNNGTVIFNESADARHGKTLLGSGNVVKRGSGTLTLSGSLNHSGNTAIEAGTLLLEESARLNAASTVTLSSGAVLDMSRPSLSSLGGLSGTGGTLQLGNQTLRLTVAQDSAFGGVIEGSGSFTKLGAGRLTLTGDSTFSGAVRIDSGTLALGAGGRLAATSVALSQASGFDISAAANMGLTALNGSNTSAVALGANTLTLGLGSYDGVIAGTGGLTKNTTGSLVLNGRNTYTGMTRVDGGALVVGSSPFYGASLNSSVTVASGASIGGAGAVNGNVVVQAGGSLAPGAPGGTFVVNGDLTLAQGSAMGFSFGQPGSSGAAGAGRSVQVNGSLALNGVRLSVNDAGGYGVGVYRLFDYTGSLTTSNGGFTGLTMGQTVQVSSGQINLINSGDLTLNLWNADRTATATQQGGGSGVWSKNSVNWTDVDATVTSAFSPSNAFAIFGGTAGTVTVDGSAGNVSTSGAQFLSDGYRLNGDALNLVAPSAGALSEVRVGNGSATSADWTATLDTVVAGNGLDKTGLGTLVLNGTNTYAQTRLSAGTLSVSSDANLGAASGGLDFQGGTLRVTGTAFESTARAITLGAAGGGLDIADAGNTFTVSQALSGNGGLAKLGAGALVLTGSNTYQGTTTVSAGRLQVGDGVTQGSIAGDADIQAGGTLAFKRIDQVVYGGAISGSGQLRQEGSGTLVLTGDSAFTGTTTIASGSLQVGDGGNRGTLGGTIINNGNLTFNRATDSVFAGVLAGGGAVSKLGAGVLTLTGDSSAYTGATSLLAGGLQVDGKLGGALWVATSGAMLLASAPSATPLAPTSDATVSGTGSLQDLIVGSGGTLAPGNAATPFGQLSVLGNLVMLPGASYRVAAAADGQHSRVKVTGVANVAGSVLHMGQNGSYAPSTTYTILSADGGVQGRFDSVSSNLAFLTPSLAYGSKQVDLTVQRKQVPDAGGGTRPIEFADAAFTGNQRSVARALQSLPADSALFRRVLNLPNGVPAEVFNGLSGEAHASTVSMAQGVANSFVQIPLNRLRANLGAGMLPGVPTAQLGLGSAAALPQSAAQPLWAQVFGNWGSVRGNGNAARTTQSDNGVSAGGDVAVGAGWRLGGAAGYSNSRSRTSDRASNSQADSYSLTVYGGKAFDAGSAKLNLSLGASYTWHDMKTQRYADAAGLPQTLKADYKGNTSQVFGELGYAMPLTERVTLEPFVGAGFSSLRTGAFSESGGDAALRGEANRNNVTTTTLGLHARQAFESAGAQGQLFGTLGWRHAFGDVDPSSTMSFVQGGASFTTNGAPIARDTALVELGVNMAVSKRTTVGVIYGGQFGEGSQQHSGTLDVRYRF